MQQLCRRSLFCYYSIFEHHNLICTGNSAHPVGDGNTLTLTAEKSTAVLANGGVPLVRKLLGKFLTVCQLCRQNLLGWCPV